MWDLSILECHKFKHVADNTAAVGENRSLETMIVTMDWERTVGSLGGKDDVVDEIILGYMLPQSSLIVVMLHLKRSHEILYISSNIVVHLKSYVV